MKGKLVEHISSIVLVTAILIGMLFVAGSQERRTRQASNAEVIGLTDLSFVNFHDPFEKTLLGDVMDMFYPGQHDRNTALVTKLEQRENQRLGKAMEEAHVREHLTPAKLGSILLMYLKFLLVYALVLVATYYGVQTFAVWRFVKKKQSVLAPEPGRRTVAQWALFIGKKILSGVGYFILFCPAYVIAYSIRTEFSTDSLPFMVLLGVISNGLLVMYSNKFYTFLVTESRKGYVETAVVKNLNTSYSQHTPDGISYKAIFRPFKKFTGHVFNHIFKNAQHQYLSSVKEQASFLVTGLIIIEMALNVHGYLNYELLRQILYKNVDIVVAIILCIFYTVKATEILVDWIMHRAALRYENR
jgi:hypothetical protein